MDWVSSIFIFTFEFQKYFSFIVGTLGQPAIGGSVVRYARAAVSGHRYHIRVLLREQQSIGTSTSNLLFSVHATGVVFYFVDYITS